jgi:hypothetical protein
VREQSHNKECRRRKATLKAGEGNTVQFHVLKFDVQHESCDAIGDFPYPKAMA